MLSRKCCFAHPVRDGITERRIIYFEICPLCSTPSLSARGGGGGYLLPARGSGGSGKRGLG